MFIIFGVILLGLAGSLFLFYGSDLSSSYFTTVIADNTLAAQPEFDLVIQVATTSVGEGVWSSVTLEVLRLVVFTICFLTLLALVGEWGEKRVLAFLVMVEVLLVCLACLVVLTGASAGYNISAHYNTALCILAAGGADTALALALFMTYYKASGETTLK